MSVKEKVPKYSATFYRTGSGAEPVKKWLRGLEKEQRVLIGTDIQDVQFSWPIGMPLVQKLTRELWEVRTRFPRGIARVIFYVDEDRKTLLLLHGFIKKDQKIRREDLEIAKRRLAKAKELDRGK